MVKAEEDKKPEQPKEEDVKDFKEREVMFRKELLELCKKYKIDIYPLLQRTGQDTAQAVISLVNVKDKEEKTVQLVN